MNKATIVFIVWLTASLQAWFFSAMGTNWLIPNFVLVLIILISVHRSTHFALAMAIWGGFWLDLAGATNFGMNMLTYCLVVAGVVLLRNGGVDFSFKPTIVATAGFMAIIISFSKLLLLIGSSVGWGGFLGVVFVWCTQAIFTSIVMAFASDYLGRKLSTKNLIGMRI